MMTTPTPKKKVLCFRVPFADYIAFEAICCEQGTNMNRALGEYLSKCLSDSAVNLLHLSKDTPAAKIDPEAQGKQ